MAQRVHKTCPSSHSLQMGHPGFEHMWSDPETPNVTTTLYHFSRTVVFECVFTVSLGRFPKGKITHLKREKIGRERDVRPVLGNNLNKELSVGGPVRWPLLGSLSVGLDG